MIISVKHTISMGHRLPSYNGICRSPHGHNVTVSANINTITFLDFKHVKDDLVTLLTAFDHAMVLHVDDPLFETLRQFGFRLVALSHEPTTENVATALFNEFHILYPNLRVIAVEETASYCAIANEIGACKVVEVCS